MAVTQKIKDMDKYFEQSNGQKIILNYLSPYNMADIDKLNVSLMTVYNTDILDTVPTCDCGHLRAEAYKGKICSECNTEVLDFHRKVEPLMWLEVLDKDIKFMNPQFYMSIRYLLDKKSDWVRWMCDHNYNPPVNIPTYLYGVLEILNKERSYNNFLDKLSEIFLYLQDHPHFSKSDKRSELIDLNTMWSEQKDIIMSTYLPIVNKKLFVMENTTKGKFINLAVAEVYDVILTWVQNANNSEARFKKKQQQTVNVLSKLSMVYYNYYNKHLLKKPGIFRKHLFGARSPFTFRSVITSLSGPHNHDEIHVPWAIGVTAFRPHILNKLKKLGYAYREANNMLTRAVKKYNPIIDNILQSLITEAPNGRIELLAQRNPSLLPGSSIQIYIGKFKTDVADLSCSISSLVCKSMNADYLII